MTDQILPPENVRIVPGGANRDEAIREAGRILVDAERGAYDSGLQVVRHKNVGNAAEVLEAPYMKIEPGFDLLVEDEVAEDVPTETQRHHEDPAPTQHSTLRVVALAGVAEVHLRLLPRLGLQRDRDAFGAHTASATNGAAQSLDRRHTAVELRLLLTDPIVDRLRPDALSTRGVISARYTSMLLDCWSWAHATGRCASTARRNS